MSRQFSSSGVWCMGRGMLATAVCAAVLLALTPTAHAQLELRATSGEPGNRVSGMESCPADQLQRHGHDILRPLTPVASFSDAQRNGPCTPLYEQMDGDTGVGIAFQDFEASLDGHDCEAADDFVVPATEAWDVDQVYLVLHAGGGITGVNLTFYVDAGGLPGAAVPGGAFSNIATFMEVPGYPGSLLIELPAVVALGPGHYWVAVQAIQDFDPFGQVYWRERGAQTGHESVWRNPGDAFGTGCTDWSPRYSSCTVGTGPDMLFTICGTIVQGCDPLYDQTDDSAGSGVAVQDFETAYDANDCEAADDFVVPPCESWEVEKVFFDLVVYYMLDPAGTVNVTFYEDAGGLPGAPVPGGVFANLASWTQSGTGILVELPTPLTLNSGHYWVGYQHVQDFDPWHQVFWSERYTQSGYESVWRNPLGGFGVGCTDWSPRLTGCGVGIAPDLMFKLCGTVIPTTPTAVCQPYTDYADASCCISVTAQDVDGGSYDPGGPTCIQSICITHVDADPVGCVEYPDSVQVCGVGDHAVTLQITNTAGNSDTCDAVVTVADNTPPTITCPPDVELFCGESLDPADTGSPMDVSDNCDPSPVVKYVDDITPVCPWRGVITRTWTATDASGNSASCPQRIHVKLLGLAGTHLAGSAFEAGSILYDPTDGPGEKSLGGTTEPVTPIAVESGSNRGTLGLDDDGRVSASEKGSVLIYPKVELRWNEDGALAGDTLITLNNDYYEDVHVVMYFVVEGCVATYHDTTLTANEATYWSAATGFPKMVGHFHEGTEPYDDPEAPGYKMVRGFIVLFATDAENRQIRWNHLYGAATVFNYLGASWEYNAYAFQALDPVPNGELVGTPGEIKLNGTEYAPCFETLLMDFFASNDLSDPAYPGAFGADVTIDTDLTLLIMNLDLRQGGQPYTTKADFWVWNQNEDSSRTHHCFTCWDESLLSGLGGPFVIDILQTDKGRARIEGIENEECPSSTKQPLLGVASKVLVFHPTLN